MMAQVKNLVETRNATHFFEASDHFAANREEAIEFCKLLAEFQKKYNKRLIFTVQTRITDARHPELLKMLEKAEIISEKSKFNKIINIGKPKEWGIVTSGVAYNYVKEAAEDLKLKSVPWFRATSG